jgi:hypothetical protein
MRGLASLFLEINHQIIKERIVARACLQRSESCRRTLASALHATADVAGWLGQLEVSFLYFAQRLLSVSSSPHTTKPITMRRLLRQRASPAWLTLGGADGAVMS